MSKYQLVTLGNHIDILSGFAFPSSGFNRKNGVPLIRIRDILSGKTETYYEGSYDLKYIIKKGDLLVGMDGDFNREYWKGTDALLNQRVCKITSNPETLDKNFLYYFLQKELDKIHATTDVVTVKHLSVKKIQDIKIKLPALEEQKRIASILAKVDGIRQKREQTIKLADDFLRATFLEMFGDPVRNPKSWKLEKLGDIADCQLGKMLSKKAKTGIFSKKYLRNANVRWRKIDIHDLLEMDFNEKEMSKFELRKGDLLVCEGGEIGRCAIWNNQITDCYYQKALHRVRPNYRLVTSVYLQEYLYSMAKKNAFSEFVSEVTFSHLTAEKLKNLLVPVPPLSLQKKFELIYDKFNVLLNDKYNNDELSFILLFNIINEKFFK
ncbi:TPA: hypothetical protein MIX13_22860 [Klebsiella pneumoniae]|nr:hypothetical protein [Klebsiella pneumoniae]